MIIPTERINIRSFFEYNPIQHIRNAHKILLMDVKQAISILSQKEVIPVCVLAFYTLISSN